MSKISVIIVNYNVAAFLEQCLNSVKNAISEIDAEVFVVDNDSADNSCAMVKQKFPFVKLTQNTDNRGFSKANNQAIKIAQGEYILLLNPDTIIEEGTLFKTIQFMDNHPDAGGLGAKMIDGNGKYLPESKRGIPTPLVAFYKISGLSKLFPHSAKLNQYHLGHLDREKTQIVDVLSGAFMLIRRSVLDKIGLLDEDYFMYGEDIDMSYRITQAGYHNYYFAETTIIHFKGESTRKGSLNYVIMFYRAMYVFAKKQLTPSYSKNFCYLINLAIVMRASLSVLKRIITRLWLPAFDLISLYFALHYFARYYALNWKGSADYFPELLYSIAIPAYCTFWFIVFTIGKCYTKHFNIKAFMQAVFSGSLFIMAIYAFIPENLRFSRALLLFGSLYAGFSLGFFRFLFTQIPFLGLKLDLSRSKKYMVVGTENEIKDLKNTINKTAKIEQNAIHAYEIEKDDTKTIVKKFCQNVNIIKPDQIVFSSQSISSNTIIQCIMNLPTSGITVKIAAPDAIKSMGTFISEDNDNLFILRSSSINSVSNKIKKRAFDITFALICILFFPFMYYIFNFKNRFFTSSISVLKGTATWVSIPNNISFVNSEFIKKRKGIFYIIPDNSIENPNESIIRYINNYTPFFDLGIILNNRKSNLSIYSE